MLMNKKLVEKKTAWLLLLSFVFCGPSASAENGPYDGSWESLQKMPVPAWFDDGKIGIFIHWGPYSAIGYRKGGRGYSEHVPKLIYSDPEHYYPFLKERFGATPPEFGYKDIIKEFKAEKWDPDAWAELFADVGFRYCVMTAEHHDGWANWDSDLTPWNAMDMGPKRDLVGELGKALKKQGLKFAPSYHRERHQTFFAKRLYTVNAEPQDDIAEEIRRVPEAASLYGPFGTSKEFVDGYVARWKEIQEKYKPDFLWIDDIPIWTRDGNKVLAGRAKPEVQYFYDQCRLMITDFMNDGAARGAEVYVNNKGGNRNWPAGVGCLEKDNLKLKVIGPKWESCTTFGTSFGYLDGDTYKSIERVIHEMVEVISRNGNFLVNIGPRADGTIPEPQMERLMAMKHWLKVNGAAIYGSRYWKQSEQKDEHLAFTTNGKRLYAIKLQMPLEPFVITGTAGWDANTVKSVRLLGSDATVKSLMTPQGLQITPPADLGESEHAWSFEIVTDQDQHHPNVIVNDEEKALRGTKKVDLDGNVESRTEDHRSVKEYVMAGASVITETANARDGFEKLPVESRSNRIVTTNHKTDNDLLNTLTDGKLAPSFGPIFRNGIRNGAYKMDLGEKKPVSAISSWSHNQAGKRGLQKLAIYGSAANNDPGWDLSRYTLLGTVDAGNSQSKFVAASLRAETDKTLGSFRWIVWAVSPVTDAAGGENTALQELSVEVVGEEQPTAATEVDRPNIVFLMTDDQRWDMMGCYGRTDVRTPNIDSLSKQGVTFDNAYYAVAICMPSRATMFTGRYFSDHRSGFTYPYNRTLTREEFADSYPARLKEAGYRTGFVGKFGIRLEGYKNTASDHFDFFVVGNDVVTPRDDAALKQIYRRDRPREERTLKKGDAMIRFLETQPEDQPFCLSISFDAVKNDKDHDMYTPHVELFEGQEMWVPENWVEGKSSRLPEVLDHCRGTYLHVARTSTPELYQRVARRFAVQGYTVDQQVARLMAKLEEMQVLDNTVVIYTSDNGRFHGSQGLFDKAILYEEAMKEPLIIFDGRVPKEQRGRRENALVSSADVAPTILGLAGLEIPTRMKGRDLGRLLDGTQDRSEWRDAVLLENFFLQEIHAAGVKKRTDIPELNEEIVANNRSYRSRGVRTDRYKYFQYIEHDPVIEELYDLETDPHEQNNLISDPEYGEVLKRMRAKTEQLLKEAAA
ncbi:MAG: alpha-L-fucosidase [Rhodopirellula sp. JB044]|uniref:alpha-L-fucosidase n=1 Tax=Rhodopirellula sp. JB044 TaxID=3342844 RepID=UPI00370B2683